MEIDKFHLIISGGKELLREETRGDGDDLDVDRPGEPTSNWSDFLFWSNWSYFLIAIRQPRALLLDLS